MKNLKKLSREILKRVTGGYEENPSGCYVCCWEGTSNCSTSVSHDHTVGSGNLTCVRGAELKQVSC